METADQLRQPSPPTKEGQGLCSHLCERFQPLQAPPAAPSRAYRTHTHARPQARWAQTTSTRKGDGAMNSGVGTDRPPPCHLTLRWGADENRTGCHMARWPSCHELCTGAWESSRPSAVCTDLESEEKVLTSFHRNAGNEAQRERRSKQNRKGTGAALV